MLLSTTTFRVLCFKPLPSQLAYVQFSRGHSSKAVDNEDDLEKARQWYSTFNRQTIPQSVSSTTYSRASGPGGQKTNKTSSKANTIWPFDALQKLIPKVIFSELETSRYAVKSAIQIQSDAFRSQSQNREETHNKLFEEIQKIYAKRVPAIASPEANARLEDMKKSGNAIRLKVKKQQSDKKRARSSGEGGRGGD